MSREVRLGVLVAQAPLDPALLRPGAASAICPGAHLIGDGVLEEIRGAGLESYVWTVNEPALMDRLVSWGVNGIITDRPGALRARLGR
jgi:glycerophosphoryl diester phosphodiesterase